MYGRVIGLRGSVFLRFRDTRDTRVSNLAEYFRIYSSPIKSVCRVWKYARFEPNKFEDTYAELANLNIPDLGKPASAKPRAENFTSFDLIDDFP